jgi:hypothetical protein
LFVLSRDLLMIWLISRCVIVTFGIEACPSVSATGPGLANRVEDIEQVLRRIGRAYRAA